MARLYLLTAIAACFLSLAARAERSTPSLPELRGVVQCAFNHDATRVLTRTRTGEIGLWDAATGATVSEAITQVTNATDLVMSPDRRRVLIALAESTRVFDTTSGAAISPALPVRLQPHARTSAVFSPRGDRLVIFEARDASIWNADTGAQIKKVALRPGPYEEAASEAIFTQTGDACLLMDPDGTVNRYDTKTWQKVGKPIRHPRSAFSYDFACTASADGQWLATFDGAGENGPKCSLQIWNAKTGQPLGKPFVGVNGFSGYFIAGANQILVAAARGEGEIRELPSLKIIGRLPGFDEITGPSVALSPDGKWILSWDSARTLHLLGAKDGKPVASVPGTGDINAVFVAPDSSVVYVLYDSPDGSKEQYSDNQITRLTLPELKITDTLRALEITQDVTLSADGARLLLRSGTPDAEQVMLVDAATMKPLP